MRQGQSDLDRAAAALAARLPGPLAPFARLAYNYRWSWLEDGPSLFSSIEPDRWRRCGGNPVRLLQEAGTEALERAASDERLLGLAASLEAQLAADLDRPASGPGDADAPVAFFCAEYAVHSSLPIYSGGLGALAGDILKEASDRAWPLVGVGLMYRQGYFRQRIDGSGWQQESWIDTDPERLPAALVTGADGEPLTVTAPLADGEVVAQIWRMDVGRVPLFLLDAERPENDPAARWTTSRLYIAAPEVRLAQYILLGVGGMRALRALGIEPSLIHLNEGHAALASLEAAAAAIRSGAPLDEAFEGARRRTVFTTHTPVPAGNDAYPAERAAAALRGVAAELGVEPERILRLGRSHPDEESAPFGVTQIALRSSRAANGVSRRHGEVAREMWQHLWPERAVDEVPIGYVTNGVHVPTWIGGPMRRLFDRHLGEDWLARVTDPATWAALDGVSDADLWAARREQRAALVDLVRDRSVTERLARGASRRVAVAAAQAFDPDVLTIGFARRVATYKRLHLLLQDRDRALRLVADGRPVQIVLAGKAHPRDDDGKRLVQALFSVRGVPAVSARVVYLEDYEVGVAAKMVQGCDVWVNLPRPPLEASGTSGMKSAVNGGLNLSVLDGWWAEGYDGTNGWALSGEVEADHGSQDARTGAELYRLLEEEVVPGFYELDGERMPRAWLARMRASLRTLVPGFSAARMLADYEARVYAAAPASASAFSRT